MGALPPSGRSQSPSSELPLQELRGSREVRRGAGHRGLLRCQGTNKLGWGSGISLEIFSLVRIKWRESFWYPDPRKWIREWVGVLKKVLTLDHGAP